MGRCYACDSHCANDDEVFGCGQCGSTCHRNCLVDYDTDVCPKCVGETTIGAIEV